MLGVQTYYARAASPAHLLYPLRLHTTSSYLLYLIESRSITIQDNKKARKKRIAIALGASRGRKIERSPMRPGSYAFIPPQLRGWDEGES